MLQAKTNSLFVRTTFSLRGPARPSILSFSSPVPPFFLRLRPVAEVLFFSAIIAASSSSCLIASRKAGTVSQRASYPLRIFALRFCSDWIWLAFFWEGERRVCFGVGVVEGVAEEEGEVDFRLRFNDDVFDACLVIRCDEVVVVVVVADELDDEGCSVCREDDAD